ncbi:MAG: hypothetical protein OXF11_12780 [Deltaproteobacteria bacterium]|nr:hypothetical protein [Deltaproteobacteria bacterium]
MPDDYNLQGAPESMRASLTRYAETLKDLAGDNARSLILFGAVAAGTFNPRSHTARSVFVVGAVDLEMLHKLARQGPRLGKARIAAPLIMTPEYIESSLDTFPLELLEIAQRHVCVFGEDPFQDLSLRADDVRHQCERELKTIQIGMRQALLATAGRDKALTTVEVDVGERLLRALRGFLWLHGDAEPKTALDTVAAIESGIQRSLPGVRSAVDERSQHGWEEFKTLYADVDALRTHVDAW